ncbi:CYTH and CHAD domain-containing protein [Streptomyces sp. 71268]|uniref:CYTH and CHAD domain-containing protein n=1 Tax=Streptomyces sp. 71268 TaxID=3002640 RepID=UPI0023F7ECF7|nr:CYTH and CHAD domain-containing protein [Streptomyces sp. 71268]WEV27864.1 CYTH and CHAD domain-containing protein [Streptomyces sp. 71268]
MSRTVREIERKYEAAPGGAPLDLAALSALAELPGVASVLDDGVTALDATYYDTADQRLAADGVTLRRRTGGSDEGWHLKLPVRPKGAPRTSDGGDVVRDEIRAPLSDGVPPELAALTRSRTLDAPLRPLVELRTRRAVWRLVDAAGEPLAEISADEVSARRAGSSDAPVRWSEVEAELGPGGDPALLDAVERHLTTLGLRPAGSASKLARALAETAAPHVESVPATEARWEERRAAHGDGDGARKKPKKQKKPRPPKKARRREGADALLGGGDPTAELTAGDVVLDAVRRQVAAIVALDPAARREAPDAVHRMRVATRRLRSVLRSYRKVLDRAAADPVGAELKWLAGELGVDRDREVLAERLTAGLDAVPEEQRLGPVRARLTVWARAEHADARQRLVAALDGPRYLDLLTTLDALRADPPRTREGAPPLLRPAAARPPRKVVRAAVLTETDRLARRVDAALALPPGPERDGALHAARKAAKRARYAAEAAELALGKGARELAGRLQRVQQVLGDHQDSVRAREALRAIAVRAHAAGESTFTLGLLYGREEAVAAARERELPYVWAAVLDPPPRRLL